MDSNSLPPSNLSPAQRKAFNSHLNDLWDDYQDELSDLIIEAKTMVPNSLYFGDDPTGQARLQLEDYARKANLIAQDYYRNVRAAWAEAAGITMPDYKEAQVSSDRAFWQIVGGYNNTMHVGAKFTDVINGRSKAGLTMDHLWAVNTQGYTEDDWARLAKDIINETARLTGRFTAQNDPTRPNTRESPKERPARSAPCSHPEASSMPARTPPANGTDTTTTATARSSPHGERPNSKATTPTSSSACTRPRNHELALRKPMP